MVLCGMVECVGTANVASRYILLVSKLPGEDIRRFDEI